MTDATEEPKLTAYEQHVRKWLSERRDKRAFAVVAAGTELEIAVLDIIGVDWWTGEGVTAKWVKKQLDANPNVSTIRVLIDSPGGSVFDGVGIHNLLKRHAARVEVEVIGEASSAASVIAMAGDKISMHEGSVMMIHRASCMCAGFAEELRNAADALDTITSSMMDIYETRTARARADIEAMVKKETWMSAAEAVKEGFADEVVKAGAKPMPAGKAKKSAASELEIHIDTSELEGAADKIATAVERINAGMSQMQASSLTRHTDSKETIAPTGAATTTNAPEAHREEEPNMSEMINTIRALLGLGAGTPDSDVTAAVGRLRDLEREVVSLTGAKGTEECVGAVRALKAKADEVDTIKPELETIRSDRDQQNFDTLLAKGETDRKLTPALVKMYKEEFAAAVADGNKGSSVVARLKGFLAAAPVVIPQAPKQARINATGTGSAQPVTLDGRPYEALSFSERATLSHEQPDLWAAMKADWEARGCPEKAA